MPLNHPPKHQLVAFGQGKLAADELLYVEQHLEECPACCETLSDLKDDTFAGLVRDARRIKLPDDVRPDVSPPETAGKTAVDFADRATQPATLIFQSGDAAVPDKLPVALAEHPRYRIVELIGRGGMGSVYRAEHRLMNRTVAIKLVNAQLVKHPLAVERFHREVQAAAKLSHPNIVAAYDAEQAGGAHFLVMEFVNGTDLATIVQQRGPMPVADACRCVRQAADGLQHANEQGMVHRDIKPHNLMLSAGNQVRILDFGLAGFAAESALEVAANQDVDDPAMDARSVSRSARDRLRRRAAGAVTPGDSPIEAVAAHLTAMGSVMGTPDYMAPEQAADAHSVDIRADIYSLGCTLHFLLTGKPPFEADNVLMKLKAHAERSPPELTTMRNDVPVELERIVTKLMAKNPAERFQTPAEVAEALVPFAQSAVVPPKRRGRSLLAAALLAVTALLAGVIYVLTDNGEFEITTADDQVAVMMGDKEVKIRDAATKRELSFKPGKHPLHSGEYLMDVTELPSGLEFSVPKFTLKRGKEVRVTVRLKRVAPAAVPPGNPKETAAVQDAQSWLKLVDAGKFGECWEACAKFAKAAITKEQIVEAYGGIRKPLGVTQTRVMQSVNSFPQLPGTPPGESIVVQFETTFSTVGKQLEQVTLYWDEDNQWRVAGYHVTPAPSEPKQDQVDPATEQKKQAALTAAQPWLKLIDAGKYGEAWDTSAKICKAGINRDVMDLAYQELFRPLGPIVSRKLKTIEYKTQLPGAPVGEFAVIQFSTQFTYGRVTETVVLTREADSQWRVLGYFHAEDKGMPAPVSTSAAVVPDEKRLQGKWIAVSGHARKKPLTAAELAQLSITFDGDRVEIVSHTGPATPQAATFTINSNRDPKQIDFVAPNQKEAMPGIYQFDGDRLKLALIDQDYSRPTNFDPDHRPDHLTVVLERVPVAASLGDDERKILKATEAFLALLDKGKYDQLHDLSSTLAKSVTTRDQMPRGFETVRNTLGKADRRTLFRLRLVEEWPGLPAGRYAGVQYKTQFTNRQGELWEGVLLNLDLDGQWRVNTSSDC